MSQLAKSINQVLTKTYNAIYGEDDGDGEEPAQLKLMTAPLTAAEEVTALYTAQLVDLETALPAALHSLGATPEEIEKALERAKEKEEKQCACEEEEREWQSKDRAMNMQERDANLDSTKANTEMTKKEVKGMVKKPEPGAAASGGGSSSSSSSKK